MSGSLLTSPAVSFLREHGFRFDLPITHGVPYLSRTEETQARETMSQADAANAAIPNMTPKDGDLPLLTHIREVITKWQSKPKEEQEEYLNIPSEANDPSVPQTLNRYQVRLTHQIVRNEFPGLKTHGMGHFVQITNPTNEMLQSQHAILERQREHEISKAIGFRWLLEAIMGGDLSNMPAEYLSIGDVIDESSSVTPTWSQEDLQELQEKLRARRKIIVGHNCFTDLVNLYKCFIGDLPEKLEDFQDVVHALFPAVIDTKHVASFGGRAYGDTSLGNVYQNVIVEPLPKFEVDSSFDRYENVESYHEAGYDSLQTAKVLIKLSSQMERDQKLKDEKTGSETAGHGFGVGDDYVTAPESHSEDGTAPHSLAQTITNVITSPVTAMKNLLLSDSSLSAEPKSAGMLSTQAQAGSVVSNSEISSSAAFSLVAVKQKAQSSASSTTAEVTKVRSRFSSDSVYNVLNADKADSDDDTKSDLLQWSDEEERKKDKGEKKRLKKLSQHNRVETMVEKGELMPRWDGATGFWRFFGNNLQVNGTVENVCHLP